MTRLLILAAFEPELQPLRSLVADRDDVRLDIVGVGAIAAAANTSRIISRELDRIGPNFEILWIGSCGKSPDSSLPLLSLVAASEVRLADLSAIKGEARIPEIMTTHISSKSETYSKIEELQLAHCAAKFYTTLAITENPTAALTLAKATSARFESMELFAVATAAALFDIPWTALSSITNTVGHSQEWKTNFKDAAKLTASAAVKVLKPL